MMELYDFQPGDATRYRVFVELLTPEQAGSLYFGYDNPIGFIAFGTESGGTIAACFRMEGMLEYGYFLQQLGALPKAANEWTLYAMYHVTCARFGLKGPNCPMSTDEMRWRDGWQTQIGRCPQ